MKKLFAFAFAAVVCVNALAQKDMIPYSRWDFGGYIAPSYNYVTGSPENMKHSGFGLDICLFQLEYKASRNTTLSLGLLDMQIDFRYLQKGYHFITVATGFGTGTDYYVSTAPSTEDARSKSHIRDFSFMFPLGFTQRITSRWGTSLYVSPGVGLISYNNDYIAGGLHYKDCVYPTSRRASFRLDIKAMVWCEDVGLMLRYQPVGFSLSTEHKQQTFSVGLAFRF